jgi:hypothetical protein
MPEDVREKLFAIETFKNYFGKEIQKLGEEKEYRLRA